jgi:hypothetical protein
MKKCLVIFPLAFFLSGAGILYAQTGSDSSGRMEENHSRDTVSGDEPETLVINPYSLYRVKARSGFTASDTVREVSRDKIRSYLVSPDYSYANDSAYWAQKFSQKPGLGYRILSGPYLRWILLSGMTILILFGIFRLASENNFNWFSRKNTRYHTGLTEDPAEINTDYEALILRYQAEGDYRMAIRFMYLRLLQTAAAKSGIQIRDSFTNADIALAFGTHPLKSEFRMLSRAYEYIFYGGFIPGQELYDRLKNKFEEFQKTIAV